MNNLKLFHSALLCALTAFALPAASRADSFSVSYLAAGVQTPSGITTNVNTFDSSTFNSQTGVTTFGGSGITGTYTGTYGLQSANQFGGAGGTGQYISTSQGTYTLTLSTPVNYFGLWFSALDSANQLNFYSGTTLLYSFTPTQFQQLVGSCPNSSDAFCGNPNTNYKGQDSGEQFAYLNFYDSTGTFNRVTFTESTSSGFESDNHAVALLSNAPGAGTLVVTPEPSSVWLAATGVGIIGLAVMVRRRMAAK